MYTAKILRRTVDKQTKRIYIDIAYYLNGGVEPEATETKEFSLDTTLEQITRYAYNESKRLQAIDVNLATIVDGASLDIASVVDVPPTQAELDKQERFRDFGRLERAKKLQELGGMPATWATDLAALETKVQTNAKKAYIADM